MPLTSSRGKSGDRFGIEPAAREIPTNEQKNHGSAIDELRREPLRGVREVVLK
jgi:hypothetical protein